MNDIDTNMILSMKTRSALFVAAVLAAVLSGTLTACAQEKSYQLSSHILDINSGKPAPDVEISLYRMEGDGEWKLVGTRTTDMNGRVKDFFEEDGSDHSGIYRLTYHVGDYFRKMEQKSFYPFIDVVFEIEGTSHYHVPITLSPYGYSTYRGN